MGQFIQRSFALDPTLLAIPFPNIDPVLIEIGPVQIRWYALAYVGGLLFAWWYVRLLVRKRAEAALVGQKGTISETLLRRNGIMAPRDVDDLLFWATLGVILGGRIGYVLFYKPGFYLANPDKALALWQGGMSFHGGLLGVIIAVILFSRRRKINTLSVGDLAACATPIGLLLGRFANFVNGELWGRTSDVSWAMVFPTGGPLPRHPSQLYEAILEGALLFAVIWFWRRRSNALDRPGELAGLFCIGYGSARFIVEYFRQPDAFMPNNGFLFEFITMGQILSLPLIGLGLYLIWRARRKATVPA